MPERSRQGDLLMNSGQSESGKNEGIREAPEAYRHMDNAIQHVDNANALTTWGRSILAGAFSASLAAKAVPLRGTKNVRRITALYDTLC